MTETEVERLVVRLVGDGQSYVKMLQDAAKSTQDTAKVVEASASKIEKFQKSIEGFAATTKNVLGAVGITATLKGMYDQFDHADDAITELTAVIKANGREVSKVLPMYQEFAKEMAAVTTSSKGEIIDLAKQTESLGLSGEKAQKAIKNAITLGAIKGTDPSSFLRQTVNFEKTGNAAGIARVLGLMGEMEEDTTKAAEAMKILENNWDLVTTKGEDGGAKITRALNELKGLGKDAGEVISRNFEPLIVHLETLAKAFKDLDPAIRKTIATVVVMIASVSTLYLTYDILITKLTAVAAALRAVGVAALANPLTAVAVLAIAAGFVTATYAVSKYNEAVKEGNKLSQKMLDSTDRHMKQLDPFQKESNRLDYERQLNEAKEQLARMQNKPALGSGALGIGVSSALPGAEAARMLAGQFITDPDMEDQKRKIEELEALTKKYNDAKKAAQDSIVKIVGPTVETYKAVQELESAIKLQQETMGMTAEQAKIYELRQKAVGDASLQASLDIAEYNTQMLDQARAQDSAIKSAKEYAKQLQFEIDTFGMSEDAARLKKLAMEGVDDETIARVDKLQREKFMLESVAEAEEWGADAAEKKVEAYKAIDAMRAGSAASRTAVFAYQNRFGDDAKSEQKQTNRLLDNVVDVLQEIRDKDAIVVEEDALA